MNVPSIRGNRFEEQVAEAIISRRWEILSRHTEIDGIEVDFVARHPEHPRQWFLECKGGEIPYRSGLARTDTVKKAIGAAWGLRNSETLHDGIYFLVTNVLPRRGSLAHELLTEAVGAGLFVGCGTIQSLLSFGDSISGSLPDGGFTKRLLDYNDGVQ